MKLIILGQEDFWACEEGWRANGSHNYEEELHAVEDTGRGASPGMGIPTGAQGIDV